MRRALLCWFVVVLVTVPFLAQTDTWKRHKNPTGNFTVLFPADPQDSVNKSDQEIESHTLLAIEKPFYYMVIYTTMASDQTVDDATYQVFKNAVFQQLPACQVGNDRPAQPALKGYIGRRYRLKCDTKPNNVNIIGNIYWGKRYAYAVLLMFPDGASEPPTTAKFLDSFAVLQPGQ
jgi:hypothetical protein